MSDKTDALPVHPVSSSGDATPAKKQDFVDAKPYVADLEEYNMKHPRRGKALIINNRDFDPVLTRQKNRDGTDVDAEALEKTFARLNFDVTRHDNLKTFDMSIQMREASQEDYSDADCFVCAILSHGEEGVVYGTNGTVKLDRLIENFKGDNCPTLVGKPKIFFIQACRGRRYDPGVEEDTVDAAAIESPFVRKIPVEADIFIGYSVCPGYFSWRNNVDGAWYIQSISKVLNERAGDLTLLQLMTLVNKRVAYQYASCTDEDFTTDMKQMPCFVSTLTKDIFFHPKY